MYGCSPCLRLVVGICLLLTAVNGHSQSRNPLTLLQRVNNAEIRTPSHRVHAFSSFDLAFQVFSDQHIKLQLEPNHDILVEGASVQYLDPSGHITHSEPIDRKAHKVFKGQTWIQEEDGTWTHVGRARIVVRRDGVHPLFEGQFTIFHDHHHIQLSSNYMRTKHDLDPRLHTEPDEFMVLFRDSDIGNDDFTEMKRSSGVSEISCLSDSLYFNLQRRSLDGSFLKKRDGGYWDFLPSRSLIGKRQIDTTPSGGNSAGVNLTSTIGSTAGCPTTRKVALVGVATDCTYTGTFNSSESARQNVITQMNSASDVYEKSFNITLGLQNLTVSDSNCPGTAAAVTPWNIGCSDSTTLTDRLNTFSTWRGNRNDSNAYWMLLTDCNTGAAVGLSWLGQLCVQGVETANDGSGGNESVSSANVVARTSTEWQVMAHETGHMFGAVHDCTSDTCSDGTAAAQQCCPLSATTCDAGEQYIMNPSTGSGITQFSPCSIGNICSALGRNSVNGTCLTANKDVTTITGSQCGNGIVEPGEDCDCGGVESCGTNACCDATTCKFKNNAVCDDSNEDCCSGCQFASASTVCRASTGVCDPQETCSGTNATCPADQTAPNGQSCGSGLQCASGQCTSRDQQCKTVMGSYTQGNDTYACDSTTCQISCASPEFGANVCYSLAQNFLDGTTCGGGGRCQNGQCQGSSAIKEVGSWIQDHKPLVIGIAAALGALLLLAVMGCIWRCCAQRRRGQGRRPKAPLPPPPPFPPGGPQQTGVVWPQQEQQAWAMQPMSPGANYPSNGRGAGFWGHDVPPPPPPPAWQGPSVRYA